MTKIFILKLVVLGLSVCAVALVLCTDNRGVGVVLSSSVGSSVPLERTGAPTGFGNEATCLAGGCHQVGPAAGESLNIEVRNSANTQVVTSYQPGQSYKINVTHTSTGTNWGFQITALQPNLTRAGDMSAADGTTLSDRLAVNGREYTNHSSPNPGGWTFNWTAPSTNVGTVKFYAAGVRIAGVGNINHRVYTTSKDLPVAAPSGTLQFSTPSYSQAENGGTATITITRTGGSAGAASVQLSSTGGTASSGASCVAGVDYVMPSAPLSWADGDATNKSFAITLCNENIFEGNETVNLSLINVTGASLGSPTVATLTITNDDSQPGINISDVSQAEGNSGTSNFTFTVSLTNPSTTTVSVNYATANGTATAGSDYQAIGSTQLTFNPLVTSMPITVPVTGDTAFEPNETFFVNLSAPSGATIADGQGQGTIVNDDAAPQPGTLQFSTSGYSQAENGGTATITVTRTGGSAGVASVQLSSTGGTANSGASCVAGVDYVMPSAPLSWADGDATNKSFAITLCNDNIFEGNETVSLALSSVTGATLGSPNTATLNITNDDSQPGINISNVSQGEGNSGTSSFTFTVSLTNPSATTVSVNYATANGTATAGSDYQAIGSTQLTFNPLVTSMPITVLVNGDTTFEQNESFFVNVTGPSGGATIADGQGEGTILNDDGAPQPGTVQFSTSSYSQAENGGTATITVTRSGGSAGAASVQFSSGAGGTAGGGASCLAGVDYVTPSGTLSWADGDASNKSFTITLCNDNVFEGNETVSLALSNPTGATLGSQSTATFTINEDDEAPPSFELILEESSTSPNQAAAVDATIFVRDPFQVQNPNNFVKSPFDPNTRVMIFVTNLQLAQGEAPSAVIVNLVDSNNQNHDIQAEAVIRVPNFDFTQVVFRLPNNLPAGTCNIKVIAHGRETNTATIRIRN